MKLRATAPENLKEESTHELNNFFRRQMNRMSHHGGSAIEKLKEDLKFTRSELNELSEKCSVLEFENYSLKSDKEEQIKRALKASI